MKKILYIYLFMSAVVYICGSIMGASFNPTDWTFNIRETVSIFLVLNVLFAGVARLITLLFEHD